MAQKKTKAAAFARSKRKPTCGGEIGHRAILRQLGDDASQRTALERFFHRPQGIERTGDFDDQQPACRQSEKIAAGTVDITGLQRCEIGLNPKYAAAIGRARRQGKGKAQGRPQIACRGRRNLMQVCWRQAALQAGIDGRHAKRPYARGDTEVGFLPFDFRHRLA